MSESVIADFVGGFNSELTAGTQPVRGRVLLSEKRLVLAADAREDKLTIPLRHIFDVAVGHVPADLGDFFDSTVSVAFQRNDRRYVTAIEADDEKIEKFSTVLFKAILNGTDMTVKHPARVGGRVTDAEFVPAKLFPKPRAVRFERADDVFTVRLANVTAFERLDREIAGSTQQVLSVRHQRQGQAITSYAATTSGRKMNVLGRYLRLEYSEIQDELSDVVLSEDEKWVLVAIYSTGQGMPLADILDKDASEVTMLMNDLTADGLVEDAPEGPTLTPKGKILASRHLEDVNA